MGMFGNNDVSNESILNKVDRNLSYAAELVKNSATNLYNKASGNEQPKGPFGTTPLGGKKRRSKRGGYSANTSLNNIAATAASYSGVKTAQPHNWVGGKSRRGNRRRKTRRTRRMRR